MNAVLRDGRRRSRTLGEIAYRHFQPAAGHWPVARLRAVLDETDEEGPVILRHAGPSPEEGERYFLLPRYQVLLQLRDQPDDRPLAEALDLEHAEPTPVLPSEADFLASPDVCVVIEDGELVGFYDVDEPPPDVHRGVDDENLTRKLEAHLPEQIAVGTTVSLEVRLSAEPLGPGELPLTLPPAAIVKVEVLADGEIEVLGRHGGQLTITDLEETQALRFELRSASPGSARVRILASWESQVLGMITLQPRIVAGETAPSQRICKALAQRALAQPDLVLVVIDTAVDGKPALRYLVSVTSLGIHMKSFGPKVLKQEAQQYFKHFFQDLEELGPSEETRKQSLSERLEERGIGLFKDLFPEDLQALLWKQRHRVHSVFVQTLEAWIPWEMCKFQGRDESGHFVDGEFFCERFAIARWPLGKDPHPRLPLRRLGVTVSLGPGLDRTDEVQTELQYLLKLNQPPGRTVIEIPAKYVDLRKFLGKGELDGLHFAGHGRFDDKTPSRSTISLDDGFSQLQDFQGVLPNFGRNHPMVFFHGCETARGGLGLTGVDGWATKLLDLGASAFLGTYWTIRNLKAPVFTETFYRQLLDGASVAEAVRQARLALRKAAPNDPSWLAYTLFADPLATVDRDPTPKAI